MFSNQQTPSQPQQTRYNYSNWIYDDDSSIYRVKEEKEVKEVKEVNEGGIPTNTQYTIPVSIAAPPVLERQNGWSPYSTQYTPPQIFNDPPLTGRRRKPEPLSSRNSVEIPIEATFDLPPPPAPTRESYSNMNGWSLSFLDEGDQGGVSSDSSESSDDGEYANINKNIWSTDAISETNNEATKGEHSFPVVKEPLYKYGRFRYTLETTENKDSWGGSYSKEYLTITDILYHATLGGAISQCYLTELTNHITKHVPNHDTIELKQTNVCGIVFNERQPVFSFEQYSSVAFRCLEWALSNPEKIGNGQYH